MKLLLIFIIIFYLARFNSTCGKMFLENGCSLDRRSNTFINYTEFFLAFVEIFDGRNRTKQPSSTNENKTSS